MTTFRKLPTSSPRTPITATSTGGDPTRAPGGSAAGFGIRRCRAGPAALGPGHPVEDRDRVGAQLRQVELATAAAPRELRRVLELHLACGDRSGDAAGVVPDELARRRVDRGVHVGRIEEIDLVRSVGVAVHVDLEVDRGARVVE